MSLELAAHIAVLVASSAVFIALFLLLRLLRLYCLRINALVESLEAQKSELERPRRRDSLDELLEDYCHPGAHARLCGLTQAQASCRAPRVVEWIESVETIRRGRARAASGCGGTDGRAYRRAFQAEGPEPGADARFFAASAYAQGPRRATITPLALAEGAESNIRGRC